MIRKMDLIPYHEQATMILSQFKNVEIIHVHRCTCPNLCIVGLTAFFAFPEGKILKIVFLERRLLPTFEESREYEAIYSVEVELETIDDWPITFMVALQNGRLLEEPAKRAKHAKDDQIVGPKGYII